MYFFLFITLSLNALSNNSNLSDKLQRGKKVDEFKNVDQMSICKRWKVCGMYHKEYLDLKKNVDKYKGAVNWSQHTLFSFVI